MYSLITLSDLKLLVQAVYKQIYSLMLSIFTFVFTVVFYYCVLWFTDVFYYCGNVCFSLLVCCICIFPWYCSAAFELCT